MAEEQENTKPPVENKTEEQNLEKISDLINSIQEELKREDAEKEAKLKAELNTKLTKEELREAIKETLKLNKENTSAETQKMMEELMKKNKELEEKLNKISTGSKAGEQKMNPPNNETNTQSKPKMLTDEEVLVKVGAFSKEQFDREREYEKILNKNQYLY